MNNWFILLYIIYFIVMIISYHLYVKYVNIYEGKNETITHHLHLPRVKSMGGLLFWQSLMFLGSYTLHNIIIRIIVYIASVYGSIDDILKNYKKALPASTHFVVFFLLGMVVASYNIFIDQGYIILGIKGLFQFSINSSFLYFILGTIYFACFHISVNITDGVDGGLGFPSVIILLTLIARFAITGVYGILPVLVSLTLTLLAFLIFNIRTRVFMGNIGSGFLGAFFSTIAMLYKIEAPMMLMGIMFIFESLSNLIQIYYKKYYKRRFFKCAPIHHHFELLGYTHPQITFGMSLVTLIGCLLSFLIV